MQAAWWKTFVAVGVFLITTAPASAQPLISHSDSLETTVLNADLVFVAKIMKFDGETPPQADDVRHAVIDIEESLKQEPFNDEPYVGLQVDLPYPAAVLADWQRRSSRLLVAYHSDAPLNTRVIELEAGKVEVLRADFTLLREPDAVIRAAREIVQQSDPAVKRRHTFKLWVPGEIIAGTQWAKYHGHTLSVPVDMQLKRRAIKYLRSENYMNREEGVRALRYFKSDKNVARVKQMLNDPGWAYMYHAQENNGVEFRIYGVRREAYQTLKSWGVEVKEPMTQEEVRK